MTDQKDCVANGRYARKKKAPVGHTGWQVVVRPDHDVPTPAVGEIIAVWVVTAKGKGKAVKVRRTSEVFTSEFGDFENMSVFFGDTEDNWDLAAREPSTPARTAPDSEVRALRKQVEALTTRVAKLEHRLTPKAAPMVPTSKKVVEDEPF